VSKGTTPENHAVLLRSEHQNLVESGEWGAVCLREASVVVHVDLTLISHIGEEHCSAGLEVERRNVRCWRGER
jgi:hypothetical protein